MNKINLTLSGELVFEYNEDGSKTTEVMLKTKFGKLISLGIREKIFFTEDWKISSVSVYTNDCAGSFFRTKEESKKYILTLLKEQGFEIKEEVILNYDI